MFADKVILHATNPIITLPSLLALLSKRAVISGLTENIAKSKALNISLPTTVVDQIFGNISPFYKAGNCMPYYISKWLYHSVLFIGLCYKDSAISVYPAYEQVSAGTGQCKQ